MDLNIVHCNSLHLKKVQDKQVQDKHHTSLQPFTILDKITNILGNMGHDKMRMNCVQKNMAGDLLFWMILNGLVFSFQNINVII